MRPTILFPVLWLLACGNAADPSSSDRPRGGKADDDEAPGEVMICNDGDMVLAGDPDNEQMYLVRVTDQGVIDWFEDQSKETACGPSYYGGTACVGKQMPWYVSIEQDPDDGSRRLMVIEDLRDYGNGRYMTSEPGTEARARDGGYDLTINGMKMPNSHTVIRYTVGHWFFERCAAPDDTTASGD